MFFFFGGGSEDQSATAQTPAQVLKENAGTSTPQWAIMEPNFLIYKVLLKISPVNRFNVGHALTQQTANNKLPLNVIVASKMYTLVNRKIGVSDVITHSHSSYVRECFKDDDERLREGHNLTPNLLTDRHLNLRFYHFGYIYHTAKINPDQIRGFVSAHVQLRSPKCLLDSFGCLIQATAKTPPRTLTHNAVFTRCDRRRDRSRERSPRRSHHVNMHATATARATVRATAVLPRIARLKMFNFVRSNVRLSHRLCKFQPITNQRNATQAMASVWTMDLINIAKNYQVVWQTDHKIIIWSVCHSIIAVVAG